MSDTDFSIQWDGDKAPFARAFVAAQKAMEAVKKAATNPAFKSKYADLSEVVEAVVPALNNNGIGVMQFPHFDGTRVGVMTVFLHETGAAVTATLLLTPSKTDPQGVGSAITYGRRYSLLAMSGAAPEDDDGNAASGPRTQQQPRPDQPLPQLTLKDRADALVARLGVSASPADLKRTWALGSKLCAELDDKDPERLVEITGIYEQRLAALEDAAKAHQDDRVAA